MRATGQLSHQPEPMPQMLSIDFRNVILILTIATLCACSDSREQGPDGELIRPARIETVAAGEPASKLRFPGRVRSEKRAELSFDVPGFLAEFALPEGSRVKAGQVVARLDATVYQARVNAAKAEFERANADFERYQRLWDTERAVAKAEVDDRRSKLELARTNLAAAQRDLSDTHLKAPFDGVIARRRVESYASVQAKQAIADLQDLNRLEIVINVPEKVFRTELPQKKGLALFEGQEGKPYPVFLKSYASEADPQTQTYEVVLSLVPGKDGIAVLPGMSATVLPFAEARNRVPTSIWIPLAAVLTDAGKQRYVWLVETEDRVVRRKIDTDEVRGGNVRVNTGLSGGERIVTAGVHALRDGMKVRPLEDRTDGVE